MSSEWQNIIFTSALSLSSICNYIPSQKAYLIGWKGYSSLADLIKQLYFLKFIRIYRREFSVRFFLQTLILPVMLQDFCMLQSRTNLLRHFGTTEKFDLENHLARQICPPPPSPPLSMLLCHQNSPDETSVLPNNIE